MTFQVWLFSIGSRKDIDMVASRNYEAMSCIIRRILPFERKKGIYPKRKIVKLSS